MTEYIDKALLKELLDRYGCDKDLLEIVDCIPADADVMQVVRCKDCKYYYECGANFCDRLGMDCPGDSDFFCSYGERKEEPHDRL